jgi:hypothetical protein
MKKIIMFVFVLFIAFALVAGSMAAQGGALAKALLEGEAPLFSNHVYLPIAMGNGEPRIILPQTCVTDAAIEEALRGINHTFKVDPYNVSVGYEDLSLSSQYTDFDYNDWITDIPTSLCFYYIPNQGSFMWKLDLAVTPQARGAGLDHAYHIDFPANIFLSDGVATLTHFDTNGNVIGTPSEQPFIASQTNQFDLVDPTSLALPGSIVNTVETRAHVVTQGYATLSIRFNNPFWFDPIIYDPAQPGNEHGEKLFFQPHLSVYADPSYEIRPGNPLMLVVPFLDWKWPEERVNIWRAYPDVIPGDITPTPKLPPVFPLHWEANYNDCVYDGIPCSVPAATAPNSNAPLLEPYPAP